MTTHFVVAIDVVPMLMKTYTHTYMCYLDHVCWEQI